MITDILHNIFRQRALKRLLVCAVIFIVQFSMFNLHAQITIGGNVYGGGNEGDTEGNTNVTIHTGQIKNVFGGARMAEVKGRAFVNIDGENGSGKILISAVYGGNDISGTVGTLVASNDTGVDKVPTNLLKDVGTGAGKNAIDNSWVAFVRTSPRSEETYENCVLVGSVFGGGNGDYTYTDEDGQPLQDNNGKYIVKSGDEVIATSTDPFSAPTLTKTYLELNGGCLSQVYGGGNNATVTVNTTISMNNPSKGFQKLFPTETTHDELMEELASLSAYTGISTFQGDYTNLDYTSSRVFGGNNKAEMKIRPVWNLQRGKIRDLYSGGNEGNMTHPEGLILDIYPLEANRDYLSILNVYGGCRRADVRPTKSDGTYSSAFEIQLPEELEEELELGYHFPEGLPARTIVRGGKVTNVYGGNDISGRVFGGNAVSIYTTVYGDVYGGGNGSYSYTDNTTLGALPGFKDFYYNPTDVQKKEREYSGDNTFTLTSGYESVEALNIFRPNAEQVSILVKGTDAENPTIIKGSVYLGGNSASLKTERSTVPSGTTPKVELKIGSHTIIDKVFLGNNGVNMVTENILKKYAGNVDSDGDLVNSGGEDFSTMDLTSSPTFAKYMDGCAMSIQPSVVFDDTYDDYSSFIGSFYCGGNVGSMTWPGNNTINFDKKVIIYDKFVGGCNRANVPATAYNAKYLGGMLGTPEEQQPGGMEDEYGNIGDCITLNFSGLKIRPMRWKDDSDPSQGLEWNTFDDRTPDADVDAPAISGDTNSTEDDIHRRLRGGNIYGGCYESGHMNGNVVINLLDDIIDLTGDHPVFDVVEKSSDALYGNSTYTIKQRNSGVILDEQGMDPLGLALNVFGGGYGADSKVWGSTTVNLKTGFTFQIFGGGQQGPIGKSCEDNGQTTGFDGSEYVFNGEHYKYDARYSTYVNLDDAEGRAATADNDVPETEFIYGGSFEALIAGNTRINLGNGRLFNTFAGSCNADILGHTETYVGKGIRKDGSVIEGFPYVIDHIYGGNDLGGRILGEIRADKQEEEQGEISEDAQQAKVDCDFTARVGTANGQDLTKVYQYDSSSNPNPSVLTASAYIEYTKGHIINIFGGAYGDYNYKDEKYSKYCNADGSNVIYYDENNEEIGRFSKPRLGNAFVNFKPVSNADNTVSEIYGAGQGQSLVIDRDVMQERSYILVDIPQAMTTFQNTVFFGAGAFGGLGMEKTPNQALANPDKVSAVIDLFRGQIKNVYGGSYKEGVTRRSVVNVPSGSTIATNNIFGGAYGIDDDTNPCDVYESHVNYNSGDAQVAGSLYGGNNNARRTIYANVNVTAPVWSNRTSGYQGTVYGAGKGEKTWAEYTNVTIDNEGVVYKVFGGGDAGQVLNLASANAKAAKDGLDLTIGTGYTNNGLDNPIALESALADDIHDGITRDAYHTKDGVKEKYNTNVHIMAGALVTGYGYGGGYGETATVSGSTYIDVLGGTVDRDIYGGGQGGAVYNLYYNSSNITPPEFTASTNVYVKGGTLRNAYGGGYLGPVGYHNLSTTATTNDNLAKTNVVIGAKPATGANFTNGIQAILRNAYGGGEGGSIYGTAHITMNNGYIGYHYDAEDGYVEELDDPGLGEQAAANAIALAGNVFGGGYIANSYTDNTVVYMYGGQVRGCLFGGGEIGPIGRGTKKNAQGNEMNMPDIYKGGSTHVYLYGGHVLRDVFGGGRGYDSWGGDGTKFMSQAQIDASDFFTKGFVFGSTDVNIRGGIVGTATGVADGYGNVFGGGDIGYVYSATGHKIGSHPEILSSSNGLPTDGGGYYYIDGPGNDAADIALGMTEDCRVDVAPYCLVTDAGGIDLPEFVYDTNGNIMQEADTDGFYNNKKTGENRHFNQGEYVPVDSLNTLKNRWSDAAQWNKMDGTGIHIYNAVFAGGNVSVGSDQVFVNSNTVFGNATAALRDVYNRDLITVGTQHVGGLYGDGNLTFVDGFRELTISNYGTDFYGLDNNISPDNYGNYNDRERAYFELKYECQQSCTDINGREYDPGATLTEEEYNELFPEAGENASPYHSESYWKRGYCSIIIGRVLNTLQRADFVGVWGSRLVLQGARDRVPEKADYTDYTINRVGEVSLNRVKSNAGDTEEKDKIHGNYFGIYSVVNYLGNLTSDVKFTDIRTTDVKEGSGNEAQGETYKQWKADHKTKGNRNNGTSMNMVSLASGVYLEIINESTEKRTDGGTDWGYITGVVQLDLINVMKGVGGGYVYAKNEHGAMTEHDSWDKVTLSPFNRYAHTYKRYTYATPTAANDIETSGNFIHNVKQIVDDCYPTVNSYLPGGSPAHYWYIKGSIFVYDQYISAFTGSAAPYSKDIDIPLTITAVSRGKLTLRDVQPNYYAYYDKNGKKLGSSGAAEKTFETGTARYALNDPISYWDYQLLTAGDKQKFVKETYTVIEKCKINGVEYNIGDVMLPSEIPSSTSEALVWDDTEEDYIQVEGKDVTYLVRQSNNVSHETGYVLTYDIDNPMVWNNWYTPESGPFTISHEDEENGTVYDRLNTKQYNNQTGYIEGPTYRLKTNTNAVYGQRDYDIGDIITNTVYSTYMGIEESYRNALNNNPSTKQATFEEAYVVTQELTVIDDNNVEHHIYPGVAIAKSDFDTHWNEISSKVALANIVTSTLALDVENNIYLYAGDLLTDDQLDDYNLTDDQLSEYVAKAYYCSAAGRYGGKLYETGTAYRAVDAWCDMSEAERNNFVYDYDALDLLFDSNFDRDEYDKQQYDGVDAASPAIVNNPHIYSRRTPVDYEAKYIGTANLTYHNASNAEVTITPNQTLDREAYEAIPNERYHYSPIIVTAPGEYYVVKETFTRGDMPYSVGETISAQVFGALSDAQKDKIDKLSLTAPEKIDPETNQPIVDNQGRPVYESVTYYYCRDPYNVNENGMGQSVTAINGGTTYSSGQLVPLGTVISETSYKALPNLTVDETGTEPKLAFTILANTPLETSTLYVSRESDIFDLSKEKIITVIYQYEYEESDESGMHITPVHEQHVVNIHLQFKSGVPEIGQLQAPPTVLPSSTVGLKVPPITPGAYEILASGWEIFTNEPDATAHKNGQPYYNNGTKLYWYQDGYWVAYFAKTYLGKTYSNSVQFSVANYHDLDKVMQDKVNHMFLDHKDAHRQRDPKIYIDDRDCTSDETKNELDLLKDFFDLTMHQKTFDGDVPQTITGNDALAGHVGVDQEQIGASKNLEFILRSDISPKAYTNWTPIGSDGEGNITHCFEGMLHGDGYTISGLNNSLFKSLCGEIYNLGVTGTFTSAGIVDTGTGYVENCWIKSDATTVDNTVKAVFGNPTDTEGMQVVNCYYPETNAYSETEHARGNARKMPLSAFYNGEVTYDLNGFYLNKRYFDLALSSATGNKAYKFFRAIADGTLPTDDDDVKLPPEEKYYTPGYAIYPLDAATTQYGYVEYRYADGDFIYAGGTIPEDKNIRLYEDQQGKGYYPIWPDDYLFFGQRLTYGYVDGRSHQDWPTYVNKLDTRLTTVSADVNRVYRAPAYFQSKEMGVAHYNPYAVFSPYKNGEPTRLAYKNMTAIDFTGSSGDVTAYPAVTTTDYKQGLQSNNHFFPPLLDNDGLEALRNAGLTRNWLVYTPAATANAADADSKTYDVVTDYLVEPAYTETDPVYRTVLPQDAGVINGHAVVQNGTSYVAETDHFLVDRQDFNAPTSYTFNSDKRMWYQRRPDNFVDLTKGWEAISIPFSAEVVTTQQKGEITHFYDGSWESKNNTHSKIGHEYWLREFSGFKMKDNNIQHPKDENNQDITNVLLANFEDPTTQPAWAIRTEEYKNKSYTNTFLWDYYYQYEEENRLDANRDEYQQDDYYHKYYSETRTHKNYAYSHAAKPYIIGFPGTTYYEFDLSGGFTAANTLQSITPLAKQVITFASPEGTTIAVSDEETLVSGSSFSGSTYNGYTFHPNYLGKDVEAGAYMLNSTGSSFDVTTVTTQGVQFRPYFTAATSGGSREFKDIESIVFTRASASLGGEEDSEPGEFAKGGLAIWSTHGRILVRSGLNEEATVHIVNAAGAHVRVFTIQPGETIETRIVNNGVFIVRTDDGRHQKKLAVR